MINNTVGINRVNHLTLSRILEFWVLAVRCKNDHVRLVEEGRTVCCGHYEENGVKGWQWNFRLAEWVLTSFSWNSKF